MAKNSIDKTGLSEAEKSRREFVKAAGKLAVYTPPALMLLMRPTTQAIAGSAGVPESSNIKYHRESENGFYEQDDRGPRWGHQGGHDQVNDAKDKR